MHTPRMGNKQQKYKFVSIQLKYKQQRLRDEDLLHFLAVEDC